MMRVYLLLALFAGVAASDMMANPIRKVVTLMQNMQKEIETEGAKEKELFDKFMCYCHGSSDDLTAAVDKTKAEIDEFSAKLKSETAEKSQTGIDLVAHKKDRETATADLEEATMLRSKENAAFTEAVADLETNLKGLAGAIPSLEKGMGGASFVQLPVAGQIRKLVEASPTIDELDKKNVISFLEQSGDYVPASGQIVGILKAMEDDMKKNLDDTTAEEAKSVKGFEELKASKESEIELASEAIETKTARAGELAVSVVQTQDALDDATKELADTQKFIATLEAQCGTKEKEWAARQKARAEEVAAISEAIGILNDDDALDVFKKAVPSALIQGMSLGLLQKGNDRSTRIQKTLGMLSSSTRFRSPQMGNLLFTLRSKLRIKQRQGVKQFEEIVKMIDDMVSLLGKQQAEDDKQKKWCEDEFEKSEDEEAAAKTVKTQIQAEIAELGDEIAELIESVTVLKSEISELDKTVADATESRKADHAAYVESMQLSEVVVGLIAKAKNRLQKFYNPTLYKAPPKTEMTMEEKIITAGTFVQVSRRSDSDVAPPPPPDTFSGSVEKKSEKSAGVMGLMDMITKELETSMKDSEYEEKTAAKEYADLMADSQVSRAQDSKSIVDKEAAKATLEEKLMTAKKKYSETTEQLGLIASYIGDLHVSCDFIMQNADLRKEARTAEVEGLKNAKAVLAGASFGR
jgi:septal ring factor EnvC (AmiA/AmiB activator)